MKEFFEFLHIACSWLCAACKSRNCCYILAACGPGLLPNKVSAEQLCAFTAVLIHSWAGLTEDMTPKRTEHAVCCHQLSLLLSHGEWALGFKHVCSCLHQFSRIINVSWHLPPWLACQSNQRRSSLIFFLIKVMIFKGKDCVLSYLNLFILIPYWFSSIIILFHKLFSKQIRQIGNL